jgi:23S rRNA pseudouridine1911/1915/1917 synthase
MNSYVVAAEDAGTRLDLWLVDRLDDRSRSEIQRWIRDGRVLVNGTTSKPSLRLEAAQQVTVSVPPLPSTPASAPQPIPLDIVYEDSNLIVIDKPAGMVVHPAPGHDQDTLVNAVLHHCPDIVGIGGERRPGIVHRLDKDTSGLIVVAKNNATLRNLQSQFKARTVEKRYIALLDGRMTPDRGRISVPLGRHPTARKRQAAFPEQDAQLTSRIREAITDYETIAHYAMSSSHPGGPAAFTLVTAIPRTGRTHQLRVHFAWMKHPIVGDTTYGYRKQRLAIARLFLHACTISFDLPSTNHRVTFHAPLPENLSTSLDQMTPT